MPNTCIVYVYSRPKENATQLSTCSFIAPSLGIFSNFRLNLRNLKDRRVLFGRYRASDKVFSMQKLHFTVK